MANTYTLISSNVLTGSAASVTFSSIPSTYTDLVLKMSVRTDYPTFIDTVRFRLNGDSSALYSFTQVQAVDGVAESGRGSALTNSNFGYAPGPDQTANTFASLELYIPSYLANQNKPIGSAYASENNATTKVGVGAYASLYRSTTAISSVYLYLASGNNFVSGSSFYLYGISKN